MIAAFPFLCVSALICLALVSGMPPNDVVRHMRGLARAIAIVPMCDGGALSVIDRGRVLERHNSYRSKLARGEAGFGAPGGQNIYELNYNCTLEKSAQNYANLCRFGQHSHLDGIGENLYFSSYKLTSGGHLEKAADLWWGELHDNGFKGAKYYKGYGGKKGTLGHWSQMAWGKTSQLGCGYAKCDFGVIVVCHYTNQGNIIDRMIYEVGGRGCVKDDDCKSKKCSSATGLCIQTTKLICEDKYSNCADMKAFCDDPLNPHISEGCPETCSKC